MSWSASWLLFLSITLVVFLVKEGYTVVNKQKGDTLSENIRLWLRTDTPGGGKKWVAIWSFGLLVWGWLLGHIMNWWW